MDFVQDNVETIYKILIKAKANSRFLIGGNKCINNNQLIEIIINTFNKLYKKNYSFKNTVEYVTDRKGHDLKYDVDNSSLNKLKLNISNKYFEKNILKTIKWYKENYEKIKNLCKCCNKNKLISFMDLGKTPLANSYTKKII